jgi:hypothetical protein
MPLRLDTDLPTWIRAASALGVPSLIAVGLAWWLTMFMSGALLRIEQKIDHHEAARAKDSQQMNGFLYAICLNTADNETERARCAIALDGALQAK